MNPRRRASRYPDLPPIQLVELKWRPFTLKLVGLDVRAWATFFRYLLRKEPPNDPTQPPRL